MKRFLTKLFFFTLMVGASVYFLLLKADGYTDPFYIRFITPKQKNLIIGSSRAAQGLQPDIFKEVLKRSFFNYCFSIDHSPFGSVYLESIKKKLDSKTSDQLFIVTVDPWSISSQTNDPNNSSEFREVNLCLDNTKFVNINPNPFYLFNNTDGKYYKLLYKGSNLMFLHDNGWLEISLDMDSISVEKRLERKIEAYREKHLPVYKFSSTRVKYLIETIQYLKSYGKVYLVRLPVHPRIMEIENRLMPDFDSKLRQAKSIAAGYLDLTKYNSDFIYTDGNHLYKESGKEVSRIIAKWIYNIEKGQRKKHS